MSKKATEFQRKAMSRMYRGKEIFKPLNTGWIDENVACCTLHLPSAMAPALTFRAFSTLTAE